jgi:hypothetical protein
MVRILVDLQNKPLATASVARRAKYGPIAAVQHSVNNQFQIKTTKSQHRESPLLLPFH